LLGWNAARTAGVALETALQETRVTLAAMKLGDALSCAEAALSTEGDVVWAARFVEEVAKHPECLDEMYTKSEAQTRCTQKWYKIAIHSLAVKEQNLEAQAMWHRATNLSANGVQLIGWPSPLQTPTVWISGLGSQPIWDCTRWPFLAILEAAASEILQEVQAGAAKFATAYPYLTQKGTWQDMFLYRGHEWNASLCAYLPRTCQLLVPELPTRPGVPYITVYNEEIVFFRSEPGAAVGAHCGSSNAVINLHLTLLGGRSTMLRVGGEEVKLRDGHAVCFQDSYFHAIEHQAHGEPERISLVIRVMHPELELRSYGDSRSTDVVPDLATWDAAAALTQELDELRTQYRALAASCALGPGLCPAE